MLNEDKIILMTKLAMYDKNKGANDKKINDYFERDYIYRQNFWTRLGVFIGGVIVWLFYFSNKIIIEEVDILTFDYASEIKNFLLFIVLLLVAYTFIGWLIESSKYKASQSRLKKYFKMLDQLENYNNQDNHSNHKEEINNYVYYKKYFD